MNGPSVWLSAGPTGEPISLYCEICDRHVADLGMFPTPHDALRAEVIHRATHDSDETT